MMYGPDLPSLETRIDRQVVVSVMASPPLSTAVVWRFYRIVGAR